MQCCGQGGGGGVRRVPDGGGCRVSTPRRCLDLGVAKQLADHRQSLSGGHGDRRESVPQVVDANILEAGPGTDPLPEWL